LIISIYIVIIIFLDTQILTKSTLILHYEQKMEEFSVNANNQEQTFRCTVAPIIASVKDEIYVRQLVNSSVSDSTAPDNVPDEEALKVVPVATPVADLIAVPAACPFGDIIADLNADAITIPSGYLVDELINAPVAATAASPVVPSAAVSSVIYPLRFRNMVQCGDLSTISTPVSANRLQTLSHYIRASLLVGVDHAADRCIDEIQKIMNTGRTHPLDFDLHPVQNLSNAKRARR
jgi:hypothetical protein